MVMDSKQEIYNKVSQIMQEHFNLEKSNISNDLNFKKDLDADSIDFVEFILELEDAFGKEIPDEDADKLKTVGDAVNYINSHING